MIALYTDFGQQGPYVGLLRTVLATRAPGVPAVDLMHDAPMFRPLEAGILLAALNRWLPEHCIVVGVVDPGVGSERAAIVCRVGERWFVGPDNGLFAPLLAESGARVWEIPVKAGASPSFHGRDVFAPAAAALACGTLPHGIQPVDDWVGRRGCRIADRVVYIDGYGNAMLGRRAVSLGAGEAPRLAGEALPAARTFSDRPAGEAFWYENSIGLVEIAVNRGNAARRFDLTVGSRVSIA